MRVTWSPSGRSSFDEIERGRVALDVRVRRQDDLADVVRLEPGEELPHLDLVRADAVERGERPEQHVVAPPVLARPLHRHQVVRLLHDAEEARVPGGVLADPARVLVRDVEAAWSSGRTRAFMSTSESARSWTVAADCFSRWKARRWAVLGPMPGRRWSASISRATAGGCAATRPLHEPGQLPAQAPGDAGHLARHQLAGLPERLVGRGEDQVLQHLRIVGRHHLAVDPDRRRAPGCRWPRRPPCPRPPRLPPSSCPPLP